MMPLRIFLDSYIRNRSSLFWVISFPSLIYIIFSEVFLGGGSFSPKIGVVGESRYFETALNYVGLNVKLVKYEDENQLKKAVEMGEVDAGIVLKGLDLKAIFARESSVTLYESYSQNSEMVADLLESIVYGADVNMRGRSLNLRIERVSKTRSLHLLISCAVMAVLGVGAFGVVYDMERYKRKKITDLLRVISSRFPQLAFISSHVMAVAVSISLLNMISFVMKGEILPLTSLLPLAYLAVVYVSLGVAFSEFERNTAAVVTNIVYFYSMFFGNMFFEIGGKLRILSFLDPVYHLFPAMVEGKWDIWTALVPALWMILPHLVVRS